MTASPRHHQDSSKNPSAPMVEKAEGITPEARTAFHVDIIKEGKKEWEKTVDAIDDIITILDPEMRILRANRTAHREFGRNHELIGAKCHKAFHNNDKPCENCPVIKTFTCGEVKRSLMYLEASGKTFDITGSPLFDDKNQLSMSVHVARDITDTLRQEEERQRLTKAVEHASEIIVVTDRKGMIQYTNPAFTDVTGYTRQEATGRNMNILSSGEQSIDFYRRLWKDILQGNVWKGRFINRKKDNSLYTEEATISPIIDADGKISSFVALKRDISEQEALQKKLQRAVKLEAIGTLAGGIAHDFNNILSAMIGYAQIAKGHVDGNTKALQALDHIISSGDKAAELIKQILTFSRQNQSSEPHKKLKIQYVLKEVLKLMRSSLPSTIKISQNIDKNCDAVMADASEIFQVIMNLFTNARQAIGDNYGEINISLSQPDPGRSICLTISDTGCGMDDHELKRVFDPFFTTKPKEHGTGLGMSVVHGIIENHKGSIDVKSRPEEGTTFTIRLPAIKTESTVVQDRSRKIQGGNERILVVDDEPQLVEFLTFMLEKLGYSITSYKSSIEAVRHFRKNSDSFDMVITDMTMPDMTGAELAREVLALRPDIPIILTTGYSESIDPNKAQRMGIRKFLAKPLRKDLLAQTIRKIFDNG